MNEIDFVILWVDGNDPAWREEFVRTRQAENDDASEIRYRDWRNLHYWFRSAERFAPWVRKVHFITWGHLPAWLRRDHPKLHIVNHRDFIPAEYLPTFNSNTIELNIHRIEGLADRFVLFNDDTFLTRGCRPEDFFRILFRCEPEHIPSVKPCRTGAGLVFAGFGEDALQRGDVQVVQDVIDGFDARTGQRRTGLGRIQRILFETGNGFFAKFYDERTGHGVVRRIADFARSLDFGREGGEEGNIISPRSVTVNAGGFGPMTFVIRIMFRRNATWQGTICWKEKRRQVSFRSFLEMLLLMQEAVADSEGWNEELKAASGHAG